MNPWLLSLLLAYLLGSIPFGYLLVRVFRHQDIRSTGSGNIGATNVIRSGARILGILTLLLDLAKGAAAVLLAYRIALHFSLDRTHAFDLAVLSAVLAVLGHVFPVWLGFRGGKGVATALGVFLALVPLQAVACAGLFVLIVFVTRYVSLASMVAAAALPVLVLVTNHHPGPFAIFGLIFIPILIILKHHANIRRLLAGTENRFGKKPQGKATA